MIARYCREDARGDDKALFFRLMLMDACLIFFHGALLRPDAAARPVIICRHHTAFSIYAPPRS